MAAIVRTIASTHRLNTSIVSSTSTEVLLAVLVVHAVQVRDVVRHHHFVRPDRVFELHWRCSAFLFGDFQGDTALGALAKDLVVSAVGREKLTVGGRALAGLVACRPDVDRVLARVLDDGRVRNGDQSLEGVALGDSRRLGAIVIDGCRQLQRISCLFVIIQKLVRQQLSWTTKRLVNDCQ